MMNYFLTNHDFPFSFFCKEYYQMSPLTVLIILIKQFHPVIFETKLLYILNFYKAKVCLKFYIKLVSEYFCRIERFYVQLLNDL